MSELQILQNKAAKVLLGHSPRSSSTDPNMELFPIPQPPRSWYTYAAPVFFYAQPKYLKDELVQGEKRAMSIIYLGLPCQRATELVNIVPIVDFITGLCSNTFDAIGKVPEHRLTI